MVAATIALLVLIGLLVSMAIGRAVYDGAETSSNTDRDPYVLTAVPVGNDTTAVLYRDYHGYMDTYYGLEGAEVAFLDGHGHYLADPTMVTGLDALPSGQNSDELIWAFHGTSNGTTFMFIAKGKGPDSQLVSFHIGARDGTMSEVVEPIPGLNASGYHLVIACEGDTVHVLLWKEHHFSYHPLINISGEAFYLRSLDGGSSWEAPLELTTGSASAAYGTMVAHDDVVSVLLLKLIDPDRGFNLTTGEMIQSFDGGSTFGSPVVLSGDPIPSDARPFKGMGLGDDGSMLACLRIREYDRIQQDLCSVYRISPAGAVKDLRLHVPIDDMTFEPVNYEDDLQHYRSDVFVLWNEDYWPGRYNYTMRDVNGTVLDAWEKEPAGLSWQPRIIVTRIVDGKYIGIQTKQVSVSSGDDKRYATELLLVAQDPETYKTVTIGKPYEVVHLHTEADEAAYVDSATHLSTAVWMSFMAVLATGLLGTVIRRRPDAWSPLDRTITAMLASMVVILPLLLIAGIMTVGHGHEHWWQPELGFLGLFYVVEGIIAIELLVGTSFKARHVRFLHLSFGLLGMVLVLAYATPWVTNDWSPDLLRDLIMIAWGCLWVLLIMTPLMLDRHTGIRRMPLARPLMWLGFIGLFIISTLLFILVRSFPFLVPGGLA